MASFRPPVLSRRAFLTGLAASGAAAAVAQSETAAAGTTPLTLGINTSSFGRQRSAPEVGERIARDDIPDVMRAELDLRVIDLETGTLGPRDPRVAEQFRARAERAGCAIINLKINAHDLPFDSDDTPARERALAEYRAWIEIAALLGARSLRPYPALRRPRLETLLESYARLAEHGERHGIVLLIENYKWIETDPAIIPEIVRRLDGRVRALVDTGNWADAATRRAGLAAAFPHALRCDFKVGPLSADGRHEAYDLRECFEIGRRAGYEGPWCIEHTHPRRAGLIRELRQIKLQLETWAAAAR